MKIRGSLLVARCSLFVLLAALALSACSAPRAKSAEECYLAADVAIVARALHDGQVQEDTADMVLSQIYGQEVINGGARVGQIVAAVIKAARRQDGLGALGFAQRVYKSCVTRGGDMGDIFGVDA